MWCCRNFGACPHCDAERNFSPSQKEVLLSRIRTVFETKKPVAVAHLVLLCCLCFKIQAALQALYHSLLGAAWYITQHVCVGVYIYIYINHWFYSG